MILVDSNILLDVWDRDPAWAVWSSEQMRRLSMLDELAINSIVYAETSVRFTLPARMDARVADMGLAVLDIPRQAAFLAGKAFVQYRRQGGARNNILADFFIGAHTASLGCPLLTRDTRHYRTFFPQIQLITP